MRQRVDVPQIPQKMAGSNSLFDASSNSGELPDLNSLMGEDTAQDAGDIKRHREKNRWGPSECTPSAMYS